MPTDQLNLVSIEESLQNYANAPEKLMATQKLKHKFHEPTIAKVLCIIRGFIQNQTVESQETLKVLKKLNNDIDTLKKKELNLKNDSILYKTINFIDLIRTLFDTNYPKEKAKKINEAREELNLLSSATKMKIKELEYELNIKQYSISDVNLEKGKETMISFINEVNRNGIIPEDKKDWLEKPVIDFFHSPDFNAFIKEKTEEFKAVKSDKETLILLKNVFKEAMQKFIIFSKSKFIEPEESNDIMTLLVSTLPISSSLLKLETELSKKELVTDLGRTLATLNVSIIYLIQKITQTSSSK